MMKFRSDSKDTNSIPLLARIPFMKMNGTGNDFVVLDGRSDALILTPEQVRKLAARENAVTKGCDQVIILEPSEETDVFMRIYNADGSEVAACGNATRCVGWLLSEETAHAAGRIETKAGVLRYTRSDIDISVDMGIPMFEPSQIPLSEGIAADPVPVEYNGLKNGIALSVGNPHIVFFVNDLAAVDLAAYGPRIERRTDLFPQRINVSAARVQSRQHIMLRVWERGAGMTLACGTAACATLIAAAKRGLTDRNAAITMPGGTVQVEWQEDNHVWLTGSTKLEFTGEIAI